MASSSVRTAAAEVPHNARKSSNASSGMDSDTGRLLNSLGSVGSSLADVGAGLLSKMDESPDGNQFQIPPSAPQDQLKLPPPTDDSSLHVSFMGFQNPLEESSCVVGSKGSRNLPESRLPSKKRKMSYESYDSAMGDSYLGLASLGSGNSGNLPRHHADGGSVNTKGSGSSRGAQLPGHKVSALDHLDFLGYAGSGLPTPAMVSSTKLPEREDPVIRAAASQAEAADDSSEETFTSSGHRLLMEAIMMTSGGAGGLDSGGRKRLESWGGMSDLSFQMGPDQGVHAAAAIAASALHHTGIIDDVTAAANFGGESVASSVTDDQMLKSSAFEALPLDQERKESITPFLDSTFPVPLSFDGIEISSDLQKFVAAAVASVGDQLAELAGNIESAAAAVDLDNANDEDTRQGSDVSSIATSLVMGAFLDDPSRIPASGQNPAHQIRASTINSNNDFEAAAASSAAISVDYDAVAAAVDAANAAVGGLDLSTMVGEGGVPTAGSLSSSGFKSKRKLKLALIQKTASQSSSLGDVPNLSISEKDQEEVRERARKAAGYVPPSKLQDCSNATPTKGRRLPPLKKRMKKMTADPLGSNGRSIVTPKISNTSAKQLEQSPRIVDSSTNARPTGSCAKVKEKSTQKWDRMFGCLIQFIEERKTEETAGASNREIAGWSWDGNVPTTYKTKDGKALGRWINNQRSARSKGTLREDRENRLVDAGLKWSVLASNSWNEMLDELRIYINEYTIDGKKWDGNVPTNYRIKARANGKKLSDEDKNLGRWVNRQRSLYQAGKLREHRQLALEKVGLKWSMLATTSWEGMFDTLVSYVEEKKKKGAKWDGNVPANYRTDDNPPRALGRWINRQRCAHVKKKLKQEYVDKLNQLGLKWSVHERKYVDDVQNFTPKAVASVFSSPSQKVQIPMTIAVPSKNTDSDVKPVKVPSARFNYSAEKSSVESDTVTCEDKPTTVAGNRNPSSDADSSKKNVILCDNLCSATPCQEEKTNSTAIPSTDEVATLSVATVFEAKAIPSDADASAKSQQGSIASEAVESDLNIVSIKAKGKKDAALSTAQLKSLNAPFLALPQGASRPGEESNLFQP